MNAVILDCETTCASADPHPVEIAWLSLKTLKDFSETGIYHESFEERFDVTKPIQFQAQQIHGISKAMLKGKPIYRGLDQLNLPEETTWIICHNAPFDYTKVLKSPASLKPICTLAIAKKLYQIEDGCSMSPSGKWRSYKLVDLCSDLYPEHRETIFSGAHGAKHDCKLTLMLLLHIVTNWEFESWEALYAFQTKD